MKSLTCLSFLNAVCTFCFVFTCTIAQTPLERQEPQVNLEKEAQKFIHFALTKQIDSMLSYTPPQFVEAGGLAGMRDLLGKAKAPVPATNYEISFEGTDKVLLFRNKMQCAFYYTAKNTKTKAIEVERGGVLGFSDSTHQHWYFLTISSESLPKYKALLPEEFHPKLSFPYAERVETFANIAWRLKPFLEVQEPMYYNEEYGQIIFNNGSLFNRLYGLANTKGEIIHQAIFAAVSGYRDELMFLDKETIKYFIARRSDPKKLQKEPYWEYKPFDEYHFKSSGFHIKKIGRDSFLLFNPQGDEKKVIYGNIAIWDDFIYTKRNGVYVSAYDSKGKVIIPAKRYLEIGQFTNQHSTWVKIDENEFAIVDTNNKVLKRYQLEGIHQQLDDCRHFTSRVRKNGQFYYGLIDENGREISPPLWEEVKAANHNIYAIQQNKKWSIYNFNGAKLFKKVYDDVRFAGDYMLLATKKPKKFEIYDQDLKLVKTLTFDNEYLFGELLKDEKTGQVLVQTSDVLNKHIYPLQGDPVTEENSNQHQLIPGAIIFKKGDKYGMVALDGTTLIPTTLDEIIYHGPQSIWGRIGGRWGLLAVEL